MNSKAEIAYDQVFIQINEILTFGINKKFKFLTIASDNENALNNSINKHFPQTKRISYYFHYKQCLERNAKKMHLCKDNLIIKTKW